MNTDTRTMPTTDRATCRDLADQLRELRDIVDRLGSLHAWLEEVLPDGVEGTPNDATGEAADLNERAETVYLQLRDQLLDLRLIEPWDATCPG